VIPTKRWRPNPLEDSSRLLLLPAINRAILEAWLVGGTTRSPWIEWTESAGVQPSRLYRNNISMAQVSPAQTDSAESMLAAYVNDVRSIVESERDPGNLVDSVVALNRQLLTGGFRMPERYRLVDPEAPYTRNLIHRDANSHLAIVAINWGPFQETRVHDHLNWGVVTVLEGLVHAVDYDRLDDESDPSRAELRMRESYLLEPGSIVGMTPPPRSNIHHMGNGSQERAVSLHTYGDPGTRSRVFDPATGEVGVLELEYHNG